MRKYMTGYIRRFAAIKTAKNLLCAFAPCFCKKTDSEEQ